MTQLEKILAPFVASFPTSRVHLLRQQFGPGKQVYIKRDDELGFGVSGSKLRKYQSLLPALKKQAIKSAILLGGAHSNNILSLSQQLIENNIKPYLFLRGQAPLFREGNFLLTSLFIPDEAMYWVDRPLWDGAEAMAIKESANFPQPCFVIPEGACMPQSLAGAATLALDVFKNQQQHNIYFDHLFIEAGTGLAAIGFILGLWLMQEGDRQVHILLLADDKEVFIKKLTHYHAAFSQLLNQEIPYFPPTVQLNFYTPTVAKSFGSVNRGVLNSIVEIARTEGFLTDPVYSAKLYTESIKIIESKDLKANNLIVHSGGALTLMGFTMPLRESHLLFPS